MKASKAIGLSLLVLLVAGAGVMLVVVGPRWYGARQVNGAQKAAAPASETDRRKIKATLFFVSEDGERLVPIDREIPYGEGVIEQASRIVEAEISAAPFPLLSALPQGTKLRGVWVTPGGAAYVDLSQEVASGHPGGSVAEALTVYSIVDALTANLPAVSSVQLLVGGREVDTLAGHVDLRRPLQKSRRFVQEPAGDQRPTTDSHPDAH